MNSTRIQQGTKRTPTRSPSVAEEELVDEGEYDDVWPARPPSSARRYQGLADVQVQSGQRGYVNLAGERHTIPPRRTAGQGRVPALQTRPSSHMDIDEEMRVTGAEKPRRGWPRSRRRFHWLFFVGLAMLIMILGWVSLNAFGFWWQITQDDWRYGRPRTFQIDQVVGHYDSPQNPSHFIAMNLNRHIIVIEIPGGNVSKSVVFSGPTLLGPGQDLTLVTLTFRDVNHDGKLDMIVNVQSSQFVFLNEKGTFVSAPLSQSGTS